MKKVTKRFTLFLGIMAFIAVIVCFFPSCSDSPSSSPEIPAELRGTTWVHADGYKIELSKDNIKVTLNDNSSKTYKITKVDTENSAAPGDVILHFDCGSGGVGLLTVNNGTVKGAVFPGVTKSGGWSKTNNNGQQQQQSNVDEFIAFLADKPKNTKDTPYSFNLKIHNVDDFEIIKTTLVSNTNAYKFVNLDLTGSTITSIPDSAFENSNYNYEDGKYYETLTGITIPNGITSIGEFAFFYCENLASVTIPNSVTTIGEGAFENCTSLASVTIPNGVTSIKNHTFGYCKNLASVTIPNSVTTIEELAFFDCENLASVTIPNSVTRIEFYAFQCCTSLVSVTFQGTIPFGINNFDVTSFIGPDLRYKFYGTHSPTDTNGGTPGTYTTTAPVNDGSIWTKQ